MPNDDLNKMIAKGEEARSRSGWELLADYLSLHGRGVRKPALVKLNQFVVLAAEWPFDERLQLTLWLLHDLGMGNYAAPLFWKIIAPTCREWLTHEPENAQAHFWSAKLHLGNVEADYRRVLELDPACDEARGALCSMLTSDVWFNQHHLPDYYINDPGVDLLDLAEAEAVWTGHGESKTAVYWLKEIADYRAYAEAWMRRHPPVQGETS